MKVVRTMQPNANGAKRFQKEWGDSLIAVRYREDSAANKILTTIEVVVDTREKPQPNLDRRACHTFQKNQVVAVKIGYTETDLRAQIKKSGARWSPLGQCWLTTYGNAVALAVVDRIAPNEVEKCTDVDISFISPNSYI